MKTALAALVLLLAAACTGGDDGNTIAQPSEPSADRVVTAAQNGTRLSMRPGETLEVRLGANETTPYRWEIEATPPLLSPRGNRYSAEAGAEQRTGAGGTRIFRFEAVAHGEGRLRLAYASGGSAREPVEQCRLRSTVR